MLSEQIQKKIEEAEKIINEIEIVKRDYKDVLKEYNRLNKSILSLLLWIALNLESE